MTTAIIGHGEYQLHSQYSFLVISEDKWFRMCQEQCFNWIKKFNVCQVQECAKSSVIADKSSIPTQSAESSSPTTPDISIGCFTFLIHHCL